MGSLDGGGLVVPVLGPVDAGPVLGGPERARVGPEGPAVVL